MEKGENTVNFGSYRKEENTRDTARKDTLAMLRDARSAEKEGDPGTAGKLFERVMLRLGPAISEQMRLDCLEGMLRTGRRTVPYVLEYMENNRTALENGLRKIFLLLYSFMETGIFRARKAEDGNALDPLLDDAVLVLKKQLLMTGRTHIPQEKIRNLFRLRYRNEKRLRECMLRYFIDERNLLSKMRMFEKDIALRPGAFVIELSSERVGRVTDSVGTVLIVNFGGRDREKNICRDEALRTLAPLPKKDLRVIRKAVPSEKIYRRMMADPVWLAEALVYTLTAPDRKRPWCTMSDMHDDLVPGTVSENIWRQMSGVLSEAAEASENIRVLHGKGGEELYGMSAYPMSRDDKKSAEFNLAGHFDEKARFAADFFGMEDWTCYDDTLWFMREYFLGIYTSGSLSEKLMSAVIVDCMTSGGSLKAEHDRKLELFYGALGSKEKREALEGISDHRIHQMCTALIRKHWPED